jgi:Transcriptional regulators
MVIVMNSTDRVPLYQQIQDYVRDLIVSSGLQEGDRIPTEKELMERFQVSKITVVNALTGLANEGLIKRVPGRGSFVSRPETAHPEPDEAERAPSAAVPAGERNVPRHSGFVGIVMPTIEDYFAIRLIGGIQRAILESGYRSMILLTEGSLEREQEAIKTLKEIGAEGMLIFPVDEEQYNEEILSMKLAGFPFVLIDRYLPGVETHYFASDGKLGTAMAVDYLWELGHRDIAICSDSPLQTVTVQERIEGYMNALSAKGALINPALMITGFRVNGADCLEEHPLYRYIRNRMATAYITLNGKLGVHVYRMAERAGLKVPDDLSIISFDDPTSAVEDFSMFTHIRQHEEDMGYQAALKLLEIVRTGHSNKGPFSKMLIQPELVIRQTTGPVRTAAE